MGLGDATLTARASLPQGTLPRWTVGDPPSDDLMVVSPCIPDRPRPRSYCSVSIKIVRRDDLPNGDLVVNGSGQEFRVVTVGPAAEEMAPQLTTRNILFQRGAQAHEMDRNRLTVPPLRVVRMLRHVRIDDPLGSCARVVSDERLHPVGERAKEAPTSRRGGYVGMHRTGCPGRHRSAPWAALQIHCRRVGQLRHELPGRQRGHALEATSLSNSAPTISPIAPPARDPTIASPG